MFIADMMLKRGVGCAAGSNLVPNVGLSPLTLQMRVFVYRTLISTPITQMDGLYLTPTRNPPGDGAFSVQLPHTYISSY